MLQTVAGTKIELMKQLAKLINRCWIQQDPDMHKGKRAKTTYAICGKHKHECHKYSCKLGMCEGEEDHVTVYGANNS